MILFVVNSIVGRPGNYGNRILPVIRELVDCEREYFVFARGVRAKEVNAKSSLFLVSHYSRLLNAIRLYIFPKWNHRYLDILIFQFLAEIYFSLNSKLVSRITVVHLFEPSPRLVKFFQRKQVKVVLDLPIAPSSYVLKNIHKLPLYPYDLRKFEDISIQLSEIVVCPSKFVYDQVESNGSNKRVILPFGVHLPEKYKTEYGIDDKFKIGFLGQASLRKGIKDLFEAVDGISRDISCELHLFGKIPPDIERLLNRGYKFEIIKHGFIDMKSPDLLKMDVMVMPSYMEGCSKAAMECCSLGIPSIVSCESGPVTKHNISALHFNAGEIDKLMSSLIYLYTHETIRLKIGKNAREEMKNWTWSKYAKNLIKLYDYLYN